MQSDILSVITDVDNGKALAQANEALAEILDAVLETGADRRPLRRNPLAVGRTTVAG